MYPNICHIYGPFYVNCYGIAIVIGLLVFNFLIQKNDVFKKLITTEQFKNVLFYTIIAGIIGGRILWVITDWNSISNFREIFEFWQPGYSSLGTLIAVLIYTPIYLKKINVPVIRFLDIVAVYIPLLHAIARIGCFLAGCCHGIVTDSIFGIIYTHPDTAIPDYLKFTKIHPTQLYSSLSLLLIFVFMYFVLQKKLTKPGQLLSAYLMLASCERFFNDFLRSGREFITSSNILSLDQYIALGIFVFGLLIWKFSTNPNKIPNLKKRLDS